MRQSGEDRLEDGQAVCTDRLRVLGGVGDGPAHHQCHKGAQDQRSRDGGLLAAALRLASRHLGPSPERMPTDPEDENSVERPLLSFLSQRAVAAEVVNNPDPFPRQGSVSTLRSRWKSQSDFVADLIKFVLWPGSHAPAFSAHRQSENGLAAQDGSGTASPALMRSRSDRNDLGGFELLG